MSSAHLTIDVLARSVTGSDAYNFALSSNGVAQILDIALRTGVGLACLGAEAPVCIDLGNGHQLRCTVEPTGAVR